MATAILAPRRETPDSVAPGARPLIELDETSFEPMRVTAVRHHLTNHPLLQLPALAELAQRLAPRGAVRFHDDRATAATDFTTAPETNPVHARPEDVVRSIESAHAWLALHNVQQDPVYRELVDAALDSVRPVVERRDPGMSFRAGWIFVASPGAVTPYHMDHEHNFILQVRGRKLLHVWEPLDREVVTQRSLELFHGTGSRALVKYQDAFAPRARVFHLEPGLGGYMPTTAPHWVKNGDGVSVTVSFTYYTHAQRRRKLLHRTNHLLRRAGLDPRPVGTSTLGDALKAPVARLGFGARDVVRRWTRGEGEDFDQRYAR